MKLTKKKIFMIVIAIAILVVIANIPKKKMEFPPQAETVYTVRTQAAQKANLQEYLMINGTVKADNTISVYPDIGGKLVYVPVTLGTYVKKGQLVAEVDPSTPGTRYANSPVYAPIDGYITSLPLTQGTTVSTSTEIAMIGNIEKLQIETKIPESKIGVLKNGLVAEVTLEAYKKETFPAHVFRISPIVDETSRTKEVYLLFDTNDSRINAGMYVRIKLNTVLHENVIVIPSDAILTESEKSYIYKVNEDYSVTKVQVEQGTTVDGMTEIVSGINENDRIVINGMQVLSDGVKVKEVGSSRS